MGVNDNGWVLQRRKTLEISSGRAYVSRAMSGVLAGHIPDIIGGTPIIATGTHVKRGRRVAFPEPIRAV
jgi:hypothetical protein